MKQTIIQKALSNIQSEKRIRQEKYDEQMSVLFKDPNYEDLSKKITRLTIENAKKEANGIKVDTQNVRKLENQLEELKKKYHLENVKMEYACPLCKDEGFIDGKMCKCLKREISNLLLKNSGFENLEDFSSSIKTSGELKPYFEKMRDWCQSNFKKNLIYLFGPTGVGKTHLIKCMAKALIERGKYIKIVTAFSMNQDFKDFSKKFDDELLNKYLDCEVLFIDDLGTEPLYKNVSLEYLYLILNERKMRKLPTVITSNLDLYDLNNRYEERIFSRIVDRQNSLTLCLNGQDKRLKNNK